MFLHKCIKKLLFIFLYILNMEEHIINDIKKGKSFNDFQNLELKGKVKYLSYGEFLALRKNTTREKRQIAIRNYYYNYN